MEKYLKKNNFHKAVKRQKELERKKKKEAKMQKRLRKNIDDKNDEINNQNDYSLFFF